jgi:hypothetical protein
MPDVLADIFAGLKTYFADNLTAEEVMVGFPDERGIEPTDRVYPLVSLTLINIARDPINNYGGFIETRADNNDQTIATMTRTPIPVEIYFQLDTFCEKRRDDWKLSEELVPILMSHQKITTTDGQILYLEPFTFDCLDALEENLFRKGYRFKVTAWFAHPATARSVYLMLLAKLELNGTELTLASAYEGD